ncbi:MAG: hypothetical protein M3Y07_14255 [Acidobacteriota bacterium]|nr:hypothetical protein [Acidobacteriota bacterium]
MKRIERCAVAKLDRNVAQTAATRIENLSSKLVEDVRALDKRGIETSARLVEFELDARLTALEEVLCHQTRYLHSLRDLTVHADTAISRVAVEVERLGDELANAAPVPAATLALVPVTALRAETDLHEQVAQDRIDSARLAMKAMFAFTSVEEKGTSEKEDSMRNVTCPKCRSRHTRRARRRTSIDECLRLLWLNPWRCRACGARFYHVIWAVTWKPPDALRRRWTSGTLRISRLMRSGKPPQSEDLAQ